MGFAIVAQSAIAVAFAFLFELAFELIIRFKNVLTKPTVLG